MAIKGVTIADLEALPTIDQLPGGLWEMDVLAGPVAGGYVTRRVTTEQYIAYLSGKGFTTTLPAKQTWRYRTRAEADADGFGGEVMEEVDWNQTYTYQHGLVERWRDVPTNLDEVPRGQELIAVYSSNPDAPQGWRTSGGAARNAGRIGLRWVFVTDPAATGVYEFQANQPIKAGQVRFATDEQGAFFAQARIDLDPEVPHPVRGVTTIVWKPITPPPVPGSVDYGTLLGRIKTQAQALAESSAKGLKAGTDIVTGLWNGAKGGVVLTPVNVAAYGSIGYIYISGKAIPVVADVANLTFETLENFVTRVAGGGLPTRDPYGVPTTKRKQVVDANVPAFLETDEAYYGCEFVDEVYGPSQPACYKCRPSAPATSSGSTVWKWFRFDIL